MDTESDHIIYTISLPITVIKLWALNHFLVAHLLTKLYLDFLTDLSIL